MPVESKLAENFTVKENYEAFNYMSNGKAAGADQRPVELENFAESDCLVLTLCACFNKAMRDGDVPSL